MNRLLSSVWPSTSGRITAKKSRTRSTKGYFLTASRELLRNSAAHWYYVPSHLPFRRIQWIHEAPFPWDRAAKIRRKISATASSSCLATPDRFRQTLNEMKSTSVEDISAMIYLYWITVALVISAFGLEHLVKRIKPYRGSEAVLSGVVVHCHSWPFHFRIHR